MTTPLPLFPAQPCSTPAWSRVAQPYVEEWNHLAHDPMVHETVRSWGLVGYDHADDLDDLLRAIGVGATSYDAMTEERLRQLTGLAATDTLAARVLLQRLIPGFISIAKRRGAAMGRDRKEMLDDLMAHGWIVVRTFPLERRRGSVAAALTLDTEYQTFTRERRRAYVTREHATGAMTLTDDARPTSAPLVAPDADAHPLQTLTILLDRARQDGCSEDDLQFARALINGVPPSEIAKTMNICERSVRNRRRQLAVRLRSYAHELDGIYDFPWAA